MKKSLSPTSYVLLNGGEKETAKTEHPSVVAYLVAGLDPWCQADWSVCDDNGSYRADEWLQDNRHLLVVKHGDMIKVKGKGPFIVVGMAGFFPSEYKIVDMAANRNSFQLKRYPDRGQSLIEMDLCDVPHISIIKQ